MPTLHGQINSRTTDDPDSLVAQVMAKRSVGRPDVAVRDKKEPKFAFVAPGRRELRLRIAPLPHDYKLPRRAQGTYVLDRPADDARTANAARAARDQYLQFHRRYGTDDKGKAAATNDGVFLTDSEDVATWLRHRIRQRVFRESRIYEDFSLLDVPCQYKGDGCDFTYKNTAAGKALYADHLTDVHFNKPADSVDPDDDDTDGAALDAAFVEAEAMVAAVKPSVPTMPPPPREAEPVPAESRRTSPTFTGELDVLDAIADESAVAKSAPRKPPTTPDKPKHELTPAQREARLANLAKGRANAAAAKAEAAVNAD